MIFDKVYESKMGQIYEGWCGDIRFTIHRWNDVDAQDTLLIFDYYHSVVIGEHEIPKPKTSEKS